MHRSLRPFLLAPVFLALAALGGCHLPKPGSPTDHAIRCGIDAIQSHAIEAVPCVNTCLADTHDVFACLAACAVPAAGITSDVIACVTRDQGAEFAAAASLNPDDVRSFRAADRAHAYLQGVKFEDDGPKASAAPSVP